jgi:hypothetical protein
MSENYNQVVKRKGCEARERLQQNKPLTEKDMQPIEFTKKVGEYYSKESIISALDLLKERLGLKDKNLTELDFWVIKEIDFFGVPQFCIVHGSCSSEIFEKCKVRG